MSTFAGQRVLVMGLGSFGGGLGAVRFLCGEGARVTVTDLRSAQELDGSVRALEGLPVVYRLGGHDEADFTATDLVVANPGVPRSSPFLQAAERAGVPVTTEICLFVQRCLAPITGITGSSGKTTTTSLVVAMLKQRRPDTLVGGNIGVSLLDRLGSMTPETPVVLELSSFQLDRLGDLSWSPHLATVTNFSPNHIDVHGSLAAYRMAKQQIVAHQRVDDTAVLFADDAEVCAWRGAARRVYFSLQEHPDGGVFVRNGQIRHAVGGTEQVVCEVSALKLPGAHNLANALAACGTAACLGVTAADMAVVLGMFSGVAHRLEQVAEVGGVTYYNDSIATSPDRTRVALAAFQDEIVLIAGGYDKGLAFDVLGREVGQKVRSLVLLGQTADAIAASLPEGAPTQVYRATSLEEAVEIASAVARPGGVVLLSPACASYGMFQNFEQRGRIFKELVGKLPIVS